MHLYDIKCPACNIQCWVNNGDVEDLTVSDVEAVRCWSCRHEFLVSPEIDEEETLEDKLIENTFQTASQAAGG